MDSGCFHGAILSKGSFTNGFPAHMLPTVLSGADCVVGKQATIRSRQSPQKKTENADRVLRSENSFTAKRITEPGHAWCGDFIGSYLPAAEPVACHQSW